MIIGEISNKRVNHRIRCTQILAPVSRAVAGKGTHLMDGADPLPSSSCPRQDS